ncbi:acyl-CoA dehydrogenase family protein [Nocardia sp. alder85J]|uniref:acyl-CoA dehydrogenase family protein n=1 Tax=Nocardia sp. alder85J TaxID=2862949 RepID=UPI001CD5154F|nr:acyl-CoA dehydrogenase family protein [Nocardia sp. alder85J]MCX4094573.1 acyl-CoA dehydrogenase family protein [Nocardia sp. alder85J]
MTLSDNGQQTTTPTATTAALRRALHGPHDQQRARVRQAVAALGDAPRPGMTYVEQAALAPALLRQVIAGLGGSAQAIAADPVLRGQLCEEAAVCAPHLLPVLTGHFSLAIGAVIALGTPGDTYQQSCLQALDGGDAVGVLMLTELGGTNGNDQRTTATWDPATREWVLSTPDLPGAKFMPNIAAGGVPKIVIVTARAFVDSRDEGVLPFLVRLRTTDTVLPGTTIAALPEKTFTPMDHALTWFTDCRIPASALLGGDWARLDGDRFMCEVAVPQRWHRVTGPLGDGRLDLAVASLACARAGIAGLWNFAVQRRRPGHHAPMAELDAVVHNLLDAVISVYAGSVLARLLREQRAHTPGDPDHLLRATATKPALTLIARDVLDVCRLRTAAHGSLLPSRLGTWADTVFAALIAEGETQVMQLTAGRALRDRAPWHLPGTPATVAWPVGLLAERERILRDELDKGNPTGAGPVLGPDAATLVWWAAVLDRLLATALLVAAAATNDPRAQDLLTEMSCAYAWARVRTDASWLLDHDQVFGSDARITAIMLGHYERLADALPLLVAALDVPDLPGSPLSGPDYTAPYRDLFAGTGFRS